MQTVKLGSQGLTVSRLGLGCMGMSEFYGPADEAENLRVFERALDLGITFFDTADMYGPFKNEELVGRALRPVRDRVVIATKFGNVRDAAGNRLGINGRPDYVRTAVEASLKRLNVDVIDLYYQHRVDPNVPIEETVGAMGELVREGKVKYLGISEVNADLVRRAHATFPISAVQNEYSLWTRDTEGDTLNAIRELGIGLVAYSPLGRGFLTGQYTKPETLADNDFRRHNPRFTGDNLEQNLKLAEAVKALAAEKGCTPAQLAIAWLLAQGDDVVPIPGTKRVKYLEDNAGAVNVTLTPGDLRKLEAAFPKGVTAGERYAPPAPRPT
ncbi:MAG TPA: aldo/keto reductase [Deinococcales bacterium]|nr:aldo/keto reductase [Deinococcales bacterium]